MTERVLSARALNRAMLARQLLLERSSLPLPRVVDQVGGLQTQYAPSAYVALWSRLRGFRRDELTRALEQRRVLQATLMRVTIHMVSAREFPLFAAGVRRSRREWWLRLHRSEIDDRGMQAVARRLRDHLANGPMRAARLAELLVADGFPPVAWSGAGLWVDMLRVPPSGTWERRRADLYGLAEHAVGPSKVTEEEGVRHLVRRYLGGFGPATPKEVAGWAGVPVAVIGPVIERLRLRRFRTEEGDELFDLPRAPLPEPDKPAPVRFIPTWEAMLLVHARRTEVLPERYRSHVFSTRTPHSLSTFLLDGRVAGSWRYEDGRIRLQPFEPLPRRVRRELEEESLGLAQFHQE
jgi:DNA glycosylase AlkZ-like